MLITTGDAITALLEGLGQEPVLNAEGIHENHPVQALITPGSNPLLEQPVAFAHQQFEQHRISRLTTQILSHAHAGFSRPGNDRLRAHSGHDTLRGGQGNDSLSAGSGNDQLIGRKHNDLLKGRKGNDILRGGQGDDSLKGGKGADQFRLSRGTDDILDFKTDHGDTIQAPSYASLQIIQQQQHLQI